ncbi:heparan sulfate glucosamine 3-O-sulfotransferase 5-like [Ptychodera flava]|uniref:heparan sulfate glucosamine 3-O-sulfotransferase 5-like n=1 Tax=Ptychodera flava TaxID=63121 RepID=UPI00396A5C4F
MDAPRIDAPRPNDLELGPNKYGDSESASSWFNPGALLSTSWDASSNIRRYIAERLSASCYIPSNPLFQQGSIMKKSLRERKSCKQRLPSAIVAGVKKCGGQQIYQFLRLHPQVAGTEKDLNFFDNVGYNDTSPEAYRLQMPYSTTKQITMDADQSLFQRPYNAPQLVRKFLSPNVKIIFVLCDPVERLLADYFSQWMKENSGLMNRDERVTFAMRFQASALDKTQTFRMDERNEFLDLSVYVQHLIRWLQQFTTDSILAVDGDLFKLNPASEMKKIEDFLGLRNFFRKGHFFNNDNTGQTCINFPQQFCPPRAKQHPELEDWATNKLCEFFKPYNDGLLDILNQRMSWMNNC